MQYKKYSSFIISLTIFLPLFYQIQGHLEVIKIKTRMPKPKDIGLIFEVTLQNLNEKVEEPLKYRIRASGYCCVNVEQGIVMEKMSAIIGGDFGFIQPGAIDKVSLVWPTVTLFNSVGLCPIVITSISEENEERSIKQFIKFDTRFEILNPEIGSLIKQNNSVDCKNLDKNDVTSEKCEEVPRCSEKYKLYNIFTQECVDIMVLCSHQSKFNNMLEKNSKKLPKPQQQPSQNQTNPFAHYFLKRSQVNKQWFYPEPSDRNKNKFPSWLQGLGGGLLIVLATIAIYLLICFGLFLIVIWLTKRSNSEANARSGGMILTPHYLGSSEENLPLYTTSSLMSQR